MDAPAVARAIAVGVGAEVTTTVGGTLDLSFPFRELDFLVSCAPELVAALRDRGARAHHLEHAFDPRILPRLPPTSPLVHDLVFTGQLVAIQGFHTGRQALLARLAADTPVEIFTDGLAPQATGRLGPEALWRVLARPVRLAVAGGMPASVVPPFWHRHLVWELSALHLHWLSAYDPDQHGSAPFGWHRDFADARQRLHDWVATSGTRLERDRPTRQTVWPGERYSESHDDLAIQDRESDFIDFVRKGAARRRETTGLCRY